MSLYDYRVSMKIRSLDFPFYALIMAAMRQADSDNAAKLRMLWPEIWAELDMRYNAPAGLSPKEADEYIHWIAQTLHQGYHTDKLGTWQECDESFCLFSQSQLSNARTILILAHQIHEKHHADHGDDWTKCPKDICSSTARFLEEANV